MASVGIDLGITNSCVGVWRNNGAELIANDQGNRTSPSLVAFNDQEQLAGEAAKSQAEINPANTIYDIKTLLGKKFSDPEIQAKISQWPFKVVAGKDDQLLVEVTLKGKKKQLTAEELAGMVLQEMKDIAKSYLGQEVDHAVISLPAGFTDAQKAALKAAATSIKLNVLRFISEPTAAAISYGFDDVKTAGSGKKTVCVLDVGGGSCGASILQINEGVISTVASASDAKLGGSEFNSILVEHFKKEFERKAKITIEGADSDKAMALLRKECEKAKKALAGSPQAPVQVDPLFKGKEFYSSISRARFEAMTSDLFKRYIAVLKNVIKEAGLQTTEIDTLVLVGGVSRMPKLKQLVSDFMGKVPVIDTVNPSEAIALGASVQANLLGQHAKSEDLNKLPVVEVSSLTLGLGVAGGVVYPLIPRGTPLPCSKTIKTSTATDNQDSVMLQVVQGESLKLDAKDVVGKFTLTGLPKAARGVPQIDVTFALDETGKLTVSAVDTSSSKETKLEVGREDKSKDCSKIVEQAKAQESAGKALFAAVAAVRDLEVQAKALQAQVKDKTQADESGKVAKACEAVLTWLKVAQTTTPALGDTVLKRIELEASCVEDESEDEDDDEDDESEEESDEELD